MSVTHASSLTPAGLAAPAPSDAAPTARIVRSGEGERVRAFGNEIEFMLSADQTGGALTLGHAVVPVGNGPPPHVHSLDDEVFIIIEGQYEVFVDGEWNAAGPGAVVFLPRGSVHTFRVVGAEPGRHWTLATPGGFDRYFRRAAEVFAVPGPPDLARLGPINAEFGLAFQRPPQDAAER